MEFVNYIGPGLAVGLAGLGVAIGQGILGRKAMQVMGKKPEMNSFFLTITILGMALVESAVIYGFIIAFQILGNESISLVASIGAGLAIGLAGLGAGIGEGKLVAGAIGAIDRNPELKAKIMTFMVLFIALVESAAIYGLVVAFNILGSDTPASMSFIGMGLAVGTAGLGVAIGEGYIAEKAMEVMGKRIEMMSFYLTITILGIALVESAAIYGLIVSFEVIGKDLGLYASIGAGLAIGLSGLGAGIGEGKLVAGAIGAIDENPEQKAKVMTFMVLFIALVESAAIYGLVIAFQILGTTDIASYESLVGAGAAIGLAGLGVAVGEGILAKKGIEVIAKRPALTSFFLTVTILGIALVESAAIYGLIISSKVITANLGLYASIGAGLAIGFAGLGAGIGEGKLVHGALKAMDENPELKGKIMTYMVLFIALVESAAIYGLVISFQILGAEQSLNYESLVGMGAAIGLAGLGVAIGEGMLAEKGIEVIGKNPKMSGFFLTIIILGIALVESAAIYGLIVSFNIFDKDLGLYASLGAGLAIGLAGLGAGIGEGILVVGAISAINKNPELKGKIMTFMVLFIALVESAAIYGLVISFQILGVDPDKAVLTSFIGMGCAVGLAGLGVAVGEGIIAKKALKAIGNRPKMTSFFLTVTILGIALVESAAIYGLVVAFDILNKEAALYASMGAGLAIGLAGLGAGIGEGMLISGSLSAIERNPKIKGKIMTFMVLFVALVEVTAIYGFIIAFQILGMEGVAVGGENSMIYLGAGLAIGLAGLGVGIGRGYLSEESLAIMGKNPKIISFLLTVSILGVALVESAAIYALIVSFQIFEVENIYASIGAGFAIGLAGLGVGIGEGILIKGAIEGINKAPESKGRTLAFMVLFVALVEVVAIYGLIIAFKVLG